MVHILRSSGLAVQAITGSDNTAKPQFAKAPGRYNSGFYCSRYYNAAGLEIPGNVSHTRGEAILVIIEEGLIQKTRQAVVLAFFGENGHPDAPVKTV